MPSATFVTQAGRSLLLPATSVMHRRQAPDVAQAVQVAEGWDLDAGFGRGLEDRFILLGADRFAVNGECFYSHEIVPLVGSRLRFGWFAGLGPILARFGLKEGEIFVAENSAGCW